MKLFVSTVPFAEFDQAPKKCLEQAGIEYSVNPLDRKLSEKELLSFIKDVEVLIAGTESITSFVLERAKKLRLIARVGIGLDNVDLLAAKRRGIAVTYTPDAPSPAVVELTICLMLNILRSVHIANEKLHKGEWHRYLGRRLSQCVVGVIGMGRIGTNVVKHLNSFGCRRILCNDLIQSASLNSGLSWEWEEKETIYREADIISIHVPLTTSTKDMISWSELQKMKPDAVLINTSRGGIVNEDALCGVMSNGHLSGVGIDTFESEPYEGPLASIERCLLTAHMGSMSIDCRSQMELEAVKEAVRYFRGERLATEVPEEEYTILR